MKRKDVDRFDKIFGQVSGVYDELAILSKKSPNDAVNRFKLKFINTLLEQANNFLGEKYKPFEEFATFDADDIPQNSDAIFILGQYLECFEKLRADNAVWRGGGWYWALKPDKGDKPDETTGLVYIRTTKPKRLKD